MPKEFSIEVKDDHLVLIIPIDPAKPMYATGKSRMLFSSHGFMPTTALVDGKAVSLSINAIIKP